MPKQKPRTHQRVAQVRFRPEVKDPFRGTLFLREEDPSGIVTLKPSRFAAQREQFYRALFERASQAEQGKIVSAFLADAPSTEWPLAGWLWTAIAKWKSSTHNPIHRANLRLVAAEIRAARRRYRGRGRRRHSLVEGIEPARMWVRSALPDCKQFKMVAHLASKQGRYEMVRQLVYGHPPHLPGTFYYQVQSLSAEHKETLLSRICLPGASETEWRPVTIAKFLASKLFDVPRRRI